MHVISAKGAMAVEIWVRSWKGISAVIWNLSTESKSIGFRKHQQDTPLDCFHKTGLGKIWARELDRERKQYWKKQWQEFEMVDLILWKRGWNARSNTPPTPPPLSFYTLLGICFCSSLKILKHREEAFATSFFSYQHKCLKTS